jgi:hypothetical protein
MSYAKLWDATDVDELAGEIQGILVEYPMGVCLVALTKLLALGIAACREEDHEKLISLVHQQLAVITERSLASPVKPRFHTSHEIH